MWNEKNGGTTLLVVLGFVRLAFFLQFGSRTKAHFSLTNPFLGKRSALCMIDCTHCAFDLAVDHLRKNPHSFDCMLLFS